MKKLINWKLFFILLAASVLATLASLPYAVSLSGSALPAMTPPLLAATIVQVTVQFAIAVFVGLLLYKRLGFGMPIIEGALKGERVGGRLKAVLGLSVGLGIIAAVLIILLSLLFRSVSVDFLRAEVAIPAWQSFLASFEGGIAEEVLLRLFLMTLLVWITWKFKKTADGKPTAAGIWLSIIISSILFGLGHLPITSTLTAITAMIVVRAVVLNGVAGIIFGWLYWKRGLESAIISHFSADIVLHVITPLVASMFV